MTVRIRPLTITRACCAFWVFSVLMLMAAQAQLTPSVAFSADGCYTQDTYMNLLNCVNFNFYTGANASAGGPKSSCTSSSVTFDLYNTSTDCTGPSTRIVVSVDGCQQWPQLTQHCDGTACFVFLCGNPPSSSSSSTSGV